jgi:hypothetical protein
MDSAKTHWKWTRIVWLSLALSGLFLTITFGCAAEPKKDVDVKDFIGRPRPQP